MTGLTVNLVDSGLRAQIVSDVHVPQWASRLRMPPFVADPAADILILAGDIGNGLPDTQTMDWLYRLSDSAHWDEGILMVMGNHDYYGQDLDHAADLWREALKATRIRLLNRDVAQLGSVRIAGCTLWTDYDRADRVAMLMAQRCLSDHAWITLDGKPALPDAMLAAHQTDLQFLRGLTPGSDDAPLVIVTHHAPSPRSISPQFAGDALNPAFVSDLEHVMHAIRPAVWAHGHVHSPHDYQVGPTRVVCNPLGYPGELHA